MEKLRNVTGFLLQDDILYGELTVAENVSYSARLRLPTTVPRREVERLVDQVLADLQLTHVKDNVVGGVGNPGAISGGQRKRTSMAMSSEWLMPSSSTSCTESGMMAVASACTS